MAVAVLAAGCIPDPHFNIVAPRVSGIVVRNGKPGQGLKVLVADGAPQDDRCTTEVFATATTDKSGRFDIDKSTRFMLFRMLLLGDLHYSYRVCLEDSGKVFIGLTDTQVGRGEDPPAVKLVCDLDGAWPAPPNGAAMIETYEVCKPLP